MIFPAMKTGKLRVITGAMARELVADDRGRVTAVSYVEKATRAEKKIRCRAVVVAASACESARLLLNSTSPRFPNGLANESGMVGRNLTDTTGYDLSGYVPALANLPRHNCDGIGGMHVYMPWWLLDDKKKDFPRGYHIEVGGGFDMPQLGHAHGRDGYGVALKSKIREDYGAWVGFSGRGEMIPNARSSRCGTCTIPSPPSSRPWAAESRAVGTRSAAWTPSRSAARSSMRRARCA
jgi:choline dehydrogenase-like flavoprotein